MIRRVIASFAVISAVVAVGILLAQTSGAQKPSLEDNRADDHGNLRWKSTATTSDTFWVYQREVENRDPDLRCRVNWEPAKFQSVVAPSKVSPAGTVTVEVGPKQSPGPIRYNGGAAAGEGTAPTQVWVPLADAKESYRRIEATGELSFELDKKLHIVEVRAVSTPSEEFGRKPRYSIMYELELRPSSKSDVIDNPMRPVIAETRVSWDSIKSRRWLHGAEMIYGTTSATGIVTALESQTKDGPAVFKGTVHSDAPPVYVDGSVTIAVARNGKNSVLAQTWVPAWSFPDAE